MSKERELLIRAVEWMHELKYAWVDTRDSGDWVLLDLVADINKIEQLLNNPEQEEAPVATKLEGHQFTAFHVSADDFKKLQKLPTGTKIYTSPPKREPVTWQYRTKANYGDYGWSRWINCSKEFYEHREKTPLRNGFCYEVRKAHGTTGVDDE